MPNDDMTVFIWWGVDASETEVEYWTHFQEMMVKYYDGNVKFIEAYTNDEYQNLIDDGWELDGPGGSGAWSRMTPLVRKQSE